jgi:hypothetical protein
MEDLAILAHTTWGCLTKCYANWQGHYIGVRFGCVLGKKSKIIQTITKQYEKFVRQCLKYHISPQSFEQ